MHGQSPIPADELPDNFNWGEPVNLLLGRNSLNQRSQLLDQAASLTTLRQIR
jgi:hypothetical protein